MRSFRHWSPRYIKNRVGMMMYHKNHPDHPWLTPQANRFLEGYLKTTDAGLEFGGGRSTIWLARRVRHLTSIDNIKSWHDKVVNMLQEARLNNAECLFRARDKEEGDAEDAAYVRTLDLFENESLDFCLVDGAYRDFCTKGVIPKVRPGGIIIIDDINRLLPCGSHAPMTRTTQEGPKGAVWEELEPILYSWRMYWTSSGLSDTAIFFKPLGTDHSAAGEQTSAQ